LSEYLDLIWVGILDLGNGAFTDTGKYRQTMSDWIFRGEMPELTAEQVEEQRKSAAEETKAAMGVAPPRSALEEARAMYDKMRQRQAERAE